jgi:hypothetical protein
MPTHRRHPGPSLDALCVKNGYSISVDGSVDKLAWVPKSSAIDFMSCGYGRNRHTRPYRIIQRDLGRTMNSKSVPLPLDCTSVSFSLDYPLGKIYHGKVSTVRCPKWASCKQLSIGELCWAVAQAYKKIYATTVMKKIGEVSPKKWKAPFCDNSVATTENPWGIWGHAMSDLWIEGFYWRPKTRSFYVSMGS